MPLRDSQFGRFGPQARGLLGITNTQDISPSRVDVECARLLGSETPATACGISSEGWLARRGYLSDTDAKCIRWRNTSFPQLLADKNDEIELLSSNHPRCEPVCSHDFIPSNYHKPLYGWYDLARFLALGPDGLTPINNVELDRTGAASPSEWKPTVTQPFGVALMIWILDDRGEILVGPEAFGHVKHPSIACGQRLWAAGEMGFEGGKLRVVNLKTGHYLSPKLSGYKRILKDFVKDVFLEYDRVFLNAQGLMRFDTREW